MRCLLAHRTTLLSAMHKRHCFRVEQHHFATAPINTFEKSSVRTVGFGYRWENTAHYVARWRDDA